MEQPLAAGRSLGRLGLWSAGAIGLFVAGFLLGRSSAPIAAAPPLPVRAATEQRTEALAPSSDGVAMAPAAQRVAQPLQGTSTDVDGAPQRAAEAPAAVPTPAEPRAAASGNGKRARTQRGSGAAPRVQATDLREVVRRLREA